VSNQKFVEEYRASTTHQSRHYYGPTIEPSATSTLPTLSTKEEDTSYSAHPSSLKLPEAARPLGLREELSINTYGAQAQLLQTEAQSTIADSITRAGIITAGTIGTIGSIGVGSGYYTSRKANAQNEAKFSWEREQAKRRERLDERESTLERQEKELRERESAFKARQRTLEVDLREFEQGIQRREEGIRRREDELNKTNKKYGDWGKELNKIQAEVMRTENELKERSEELRRTAMNLREREDELSRTEKEHLERGKELNKIQAEITRSEHELRQKSEVLRERENEWSQQQQHCHCRHQALERNSITSSRTSSTSENEPPRPNLSTAPLETTKCSTLPTMDQRCNQIHSSPSLADEDLDSNQQSISSSSSTASQSSTAEANISSQPFTMNIPDTEPTASNAALVTSNLVSSQLKGQLLTDANLGFQVRSPNMNIRKTSH
jgi:hypothetical protein